MKLWQATIGGLCALVAGLMLLTSCGTLAPDGVYKSDELLYRADQTITTSYSVLHEFVSWEYNNRAGLRALPQIKQAADHIRLNSRSWLRTAIALREAYAIDPSSDNEAALERSLSVLRTALIEATRYLNEGQRLSTLTTDMPPLPPG